MTDTGNPFDVLDSTPVESASVDSAPETNGAAPEAAAESASPESTEPAAAPTDPAPQSGEQPTDEFAGEIDPENLRRLFKTHPELRDVYYREKAYNALGPVAEYREIKSLLPTVEDARHAVEAIQQLDRLTSALQSAPDQLVESLKQTAPEAYAKIFDSIATRGWTNFWNGVRTNFGADEEVQAALEVLEAKVLGGKVGNAQAKADPLAGDPRLQRLEQMESQVKQAEAQRYQQTISSIDDNFRSTVEQEVRSLVGTPQGMNPKLVDRIVSDIVDEAGKAFRATPTNLRALQPLVAQAAQGQLPVDKILDAMMSRIRPHIRDIGARQMREWTATVVGTANQRVAAAKGQRPDVGAGAPVSPAPASYGSKRGEDLFASVLGLD